MSIDIADIEANIDELPTGAPKLVLSASAPAQPSKRPAPIIPLEKSSSDPLLSKNTTGRRSVDDWFNISMISPVLMRRISSSGLSTFNCAICLENHPSSEGFSMVSCELEHTFCRHSMKCFLESQINDGILTFKCPMYGQCAGTMSESEIQDLLGESVVEKYLRFKEIKTNKNYRECPHCQQSVIGDPEAPSITCPKCNQEYCYFHANAHPTQSCEEYSRKQSRSEMKSRSLISSITIKCPKCGSETEKSGGCNHMTCQYCRQDWCWLCGKAITDTPPERHYSVGSLCYGGLLTPTPSWTCWAMCPLSRRTLFLVFSSWQYLLLAAVLVVFFAVCALGCCVAIACAPFAFAGALISIKEDGDSFKKDEIMNKTQSFMTVIGLAVVMFIGGVLTLACEIAWAPIILLWIGALHAGKAVGMRFDTVGLMGEAGGGDRCLEVWGFPLMFILGGIIPVCHFLGLENFGQD